MNTKFRFTRFVFALMLVISAVAIPASTVLAADQVKEEYDFTMDLTMNDVCAFPINMFGMVHTVHIMFFDNDGNFTRMNFNSVQTDTFSANGKTLVGLPHTYAGELFMKPAGVIHLYRNGVQEKVLLPDGSYFVSAGRFDWAAPGAKNDLILIPTVGVSHNLAGFCAALAP